MRLRSAIVSIAVSATSVAAFVACGSDLTARFDGPPSAAADAAGGDADFGPPVGSDAGAVGSASGVVILHAASFPSFRLCFEGYPELLPQPDQTVMPRANMVGVEVGSVVRIGSLAKPPGMVYVIIQRKLPATPGDTTGKSCGELLESGDLTRNLEYHEAGELTEPLGVGRVSVLGITGCGGKAILESLGMATSECGPEWDETAGSLHARTLTLLPTIAATDSSLPVQVVHMSSILESTRAPGEQLDVSYGALDAGPEAPLAQHVASSPPLFDASAPVTLALDQSSEATFGREGFRIALRAEDGGAPSFVVDQSLAEVQELSSPQTDTTQYYLAASNYALLLLGDPRMRRALPDGGTNPDYDARRAVHLLAVPVKEDADAGEPIADDAGATDQ